MAAARKTLVVVACVVCALAALRLAFSTWMDVSMYGFPDGHVTDFQTAAGTPLTIAAWIEAALGLLFLVLAFWPVGARTRFVGLLAALAGLAVVAMAARVGVPWYFGTHLGLDNGIGG